MIHQRMARVSSRLGKPRHEVAHMQVGSCDAWQSDHPLHHQHIYRACVIPNMNQGHTNWLAGLAVIKDHLYTKSP